MIAEVYPIKRMPRKVGVFDYEVPEGLYVKTGSFVQIPFRKQTLWGIVKTVKDTKEVKYQCKELLGIHEELVFGHEEIAYFENIAHDLAQSVPSLLHAALPKPLSRASKEPEKPIKKTLTVPSSETETILTALSTLRARKNGFVICPDLKRMAALIAGYVAQEQKHIVAVICPNVRDAELLAGALQHLVPSFITGEESNGARWKAWMRWRKDETRVMIATRIGALLPHPALSTVFVVRSGHANHKQKDQNPRYDTRHALRIWHEATHGKLFFMDVMPRVDDLAWLNHSDVVDPFKKAPYTLVDLKRERPTAPHPALGSTTIEKIELALKAKKQVLCVYNKKGVSRRLACKECEHDFPCRSCAAPMIAFEQMIACGRCGHKEALPMNCPLCKSVNIKPKGYGNRGIKTALQKLLPTATIALIEKDSEQINKEADILLVTSYYTEQIHDPFEKNRFGLVVQLDADLALYQPTFRAVERAMTDLSLWQGVAKNAGCEMVAQTQSAGLLEQALTEPYKVHQNELAMRQMYQHPPYKRWMRITARGDAKIQTNLIADAANTLRGQLEHNQIIRTKYRQLPALELMVDPQQLSQLLSTFYTFPDALLIDTNVFL
jgi:primosomal protein N'